VRAYYFSTHGCDIGTSGAICYSSAATVAAVARGQWWRVGGLLLRFRALRFSVSSSHKDFWASVSPVVGTG